MYSVLVVAKPTAPIRELTHALARHKQIEARVVSEITPADAVAMAVVDVTYNLPSVAFRPADGSPGCMVALTPQGVAVPKPWEERFRKMTIPVMYASVPIRKRKLLSLILSEYIADDEAISERERKAISALRAAGAAGMSASDLAVHIWGSSDIWAMARLRQTLYRLRRRAGANSVLYHPESKLYTAPPVTS